MYCSICNTKLYSKNKSGYCFNCGNFSRIIQNSVQQCAVCNGLGCITCNQTGVLKTGSTQMPPFTRARSGFQSKSAKQKEARLIYEPALQGYSLKFSYDPGLVDFIKKVIPSHKRTTSGPPDWIWYFPSEFFDIVKVMFEGHREFKLTIVTEEEVLNKIKEQEESSRSDWRPREYSIEDELKKFYNILWPLPINNGQGLTLEQVKNYNKNEATKVYRKASMLIHPDRNGGDSTKMSELNAVWAILKEGYYIK